MRPLALLRVAVAALILASGLFAPLASPSPARGVGPLPDCRLDDILTEPRGYDDWEVTLVDWILTLGPKYRPRDLVSVRDGGVAGGGLIRAVVIEDLKAMAAAAEKNGTPLVSLSPFRSYKQQRALFNGYAGWTGSKYTNFDSAITFSARPGHSEHQTGLTIDFVAVGDTDLTSNWEVTRTGGWMARNAWKYGWLMSYPKGEKDAVCYRYEPWHYRYVGREMAAKIRESGLTIREYLWANHTQLDPACVALPAPELKTPGKPRSCAFPAPSPTAVPPTATAVPSSSAGPTNGGASPSTSGPAATSPPTSPTGTVLGIELQTAIAIALVIALVAGLLALSMKRRRSRRGW
ncbi:MAG TPA: D-alanyl-D-alanine carboxypeptidase family protein [Candidatus Limnocylindria bacterium]|nr:D-alanyl-D-alanine carboxypeptidase family protein [Candidatus Limnocylindria bacterium]